MADIEYIGGVTTSDNSTDGVYTHSTVSIGAASTHREVIVGVGYYDVSGSSDLSGVTIGGITATIYIDRPTSSGASKFAGCAIVSATVPTGTTANIVLTWVGNNVNGSSVCVWRSDHLFDGTAFDTDSAFSIHTDRTDSGDVDFPDNGIIIGIATNEEEVNQNPTWSGDGNLVKQTKLTSNFNTSPAFVGSLSSGLDADSTVTWSKDGDSALCLASFNTHSPANYLTPRTMIY